MSTVFEPGENTVADTFADTDTVAETITWVVFWADMWIVVMEYSANNSKEREITVLPLIQPQML